MANWSKLPYDIIGEIVKRLPLNAEEFARFISVCKAWKAVGFDKKLHTKPCSPWLMIQRKENDVVSNEANEEGVVRFFIVSSNRIVDIVLPIQGKRCLGTRFGWVVTMGLDLNITLLHPLSRAQISLPLQSTFPYKQRRESEKSEKLCTEFVLRYALSSNPSLWNTSTPLTNESDKCPLVMAIIGRQCHLAFASPGDKAWTSLKAPLGKDAYDVIFYNGDFYVVVHSGRLGIFDISTNQIKEVGPLDDVMNFEAFYLTELSGDLVLIGRDFETVDGRVVGEDEDIHPEDILIPSGFYWPDCHFVTVRFCVFKFDFSAKKWTKVENLGNHALFVGHHESFSISTSEYPGFMANCIYFTDDHRDIYSHGFCDMGVFDLGKNTTVPVPLSNLSKISRPLFFMPTLQ